MLIKSIFYKNYLRSLKLHKLIKHELPKPQTLFQAYKEIIPAVIKKAKDPKYFIPVKIP